MHTILLSRRLCRWLVVAVLGLLAVPAHAQLTGLKAIPGDYATVAAAITDLNTQGVGAGGVTFNIAAGYTETFASPTAGAITATGTAANPIVFQKAGAGTNPKITAGVGTTAALDAIISLAGSDYVTFDGLELAESAANTTATTQMEFGFALFRPSPTDGCQNNIIRNCVVTLNKTNTGTFGIYGAASTAASATSVAATSPAGANSGNKVNGTIITNSASGMYFTASTATAVANYDLNNEIGVTAANQVYNFGTTATGWGIGGNYQSGLKIVNNVVNNTLNYANGATTAVPASTVTSTLRGIYGNTGASASIDITGNTVTLASGATTSLMTGIDNGIGSTPASNTVTISGNTVQLTYATATTGAITGITNSGAATTVNITGNTVQNSTAAAATTASFTGIITSVGSAINLNNNTVSNNVIAGTGTMTLISSSLVAASTPVSISNNTLTGNSKTPTGTTSSTTLLGITLGTATTTITGNTITNNSIVTAGTSTTAGTLVGINSTASSTPSENISTNVITGLSISGTSTATTHVLRGILTSASSSSVQTLAQNTVGNLAIASGSGTVTGISLASGGATGSLVSRNKIYDLSATGAAGSVTGLLVSAGGTHTIANNLIGDLRTPAATGLVAIAGLNVASSTAVNAYYNTIYLNASSSGATFGTSGIYLGSTSTTLDARNNVVVNKSTAAGTGGFTAAFRRVSGTAGTAPANLASTTNNNLYYAGTPSATNLIYVEGTTAATNAQQTIAAYRALMASRESNSVTEDVPFVSTTGTAATFLHVSTTTPTQVEGTGTPISSITVDFDGDTRSTTTPDLGADEGTFQPLDITAPTITLSPLTPTSSTANRTLAVTITDLSGISTTVPPRLFYRKGTTGAFISALATSTSGNTYTFTFDYAALGGVALGDVVQYYVVAQDALGNTASNPAGGTFSTSPATVYQFSISALSGVYYVGAGTSPDPTRTYATLSAAATAYNTSGLGGAVTFLLLDATYSTAETFPIVFGNNVEASATNTLTIRPNTGVTSTITGASSLLAFQNPRYITLDGSNTAGGTTRNLTLTTTSTTSGSYHVFVLSPTGSQGSTTTAIRNLNIVGGSAITSGVFGIVAQGPDNDNLTVQNNSIVGVTTGIQINGTATVSAGGNDNVVVQDNVVGPATAATASNIGTTALYVGNSVNATINGNTLQNVTSASAPYGLNVVGVTGGTVNGNTVRAITNTSSGYAYGINLSTGSTGLVVDANRISGVTAAGTGGFGGYGIRVSTATANSNLRISNNFISDIQGTSYTGLTSGATVGLLLTSTMSGVSLYYNSVSLTGTYNYAAGFSVAFGVDASVTGLNVQNNIFANSQVNGTGTTGSAYAFYSAAPAAAYTTLNYNDYYSGGTQAVLAYFGSAQTTLAALRTATGKDQNSLNVDPLFASATDLHVSAAALNNAGTPIAGITTDFDGETRSTTTPDIGADEFTPSPVDIAPTVLLNPLTTGCYTASETVAVTISNNATAALNFALNPTVVTVTVTKPNSTTQVFTLTLNTGTLAAGTTRTVTLPGTLDLSVAGTYSFAVTTVTTGDGNTANDNLTATRTVLGVATQPQLVTFTGFTGSNLSTVFPGWSEATGATLPTGTTSAWLSQTNFGGTGNTTAKINLYTTGKNDWIVSPKFLATASTVLTFDAGLSEYAGTTADPAGMTGTDDFMEVRISTDCGLTFARIPAFAQFNAGNQPSNGSLTNYTIDLSAYAGQQIILGFFASEGTVDDTPDYDFHLDNISVRSPLAIDLAPLALATPTATQGCYSAAETVSVTVTNLGLQTLDFATNPATVTAVVTTPGGPQTLTATVSTGTLAPNATQTVTLAPTLDMSALGTYSFAITATVQGDLVTSNDALAAVTRTVAAPVAGTLAPVSTSICVSGTVTLSLTGAANGSIQYQSSPDNVTFTDISGATSAAYTTSVLTATTYFRAQVRCNTRVATSNVSTITVNNPLVATTNTPLTICAGSTATLTATASTGANVRFFDVATGGTALTSTTPGLYTTPALTASTTYYAEAFSGGTENVGPTAQTSTGLTPQTGGALYFTTTRALTISTVTVFLNAGQVAGTVTIALRSGSGTGGTIVNGQNLAFAVPAGPATGTASYVVPLNYSVPAAGQYTLHLSAASQSGLLRDDAGANLTGYPYTSPSGALSITAANLTGYYYYFYNWQISTECAGATRTAIQVNVTQPATASFPAATASSCGTSPYQLAGTVTGSATTGTYTSSGTGTFSPNATTLNATYTPSAADVAAGTVTITLTSAASGPCAATTATLTLSIGAAPVATFSYGTTPTYCVSGTTAPAVVLGTGAIAGTFSSTAGLTLNATTGAITLASSTPGTYTVTNTVAASGNCAAATATATVTITAAPVATFSYANASACAGSATLLTPTTGAGATAGTFSSTAGLTINATTGAVNPATSTAGTYTVTNTVAASGGCAATTATTTVTINALPATPTVTVTYPTRSTAVFTSSAAPAGTTYQWYLNAVAIAGATAQTYTANGATAPGAYTVCITNTATGCQSCSNVTTVTPTTQPLAGSTLRLFPNPTTDGKLTLELTGYSKAVQLTVFDAVGRVVLSQQVAAGQAQTQLDLSGQATGVYLLRATSEGGTDVRRIVRE